MKLYLLVTVDTHQLLGVFPSRDDAVLAGDNVASHCEIYVVSADD